MVSFDNFHEEDKKYAIISQHIQELTNDESEDRTQNKTKQKILKIKQTAPVSNSDLNAS